MALAESRESSSKLCLSAATRYDMINVMFDARSVLLLTVNFCPAEVQHTLSYNRGVLITKPLS